MGTGEMLRANPEEGVKDFSPGVFRVRTEANNVLREHGRGSEIICRMREDCRSGGYEEKKEEEDVSRRGSH